MLELLTGVVVAAVAVALVLEPLVRGARSVRPTLPSDPDLELLDIEESDSAKVRALVALREVEFDRATGKLAEEDYVALKQKYARAALAALDAEPAGDAEDLSDDAVEQVVRRMKVQLGAPCAACGDRPEPDAVFCSTCGRPLGSADAKARCWTCGADLPEDAQFCGECGLALSA